jgi:MFS family permease
MATVTDVAASSSKAASSPAPARVAGYSWFVASALMVVYTFNFLDRQFLSVLAEPVKNDLGLSDTQLGMLTGLMFALFYTVCGIPVASIADRWNRVKLISIACGLWSLFTAACGFATSFTTLALARMGVGIGEAGGSPPSYSVVSDYFPPEKRGVGLALYSLGVPFGSMIGTMAGGFIAANFGWRAAFITLGVLGLILAPIIPLVIKEPVRGALDRKPAPGPDGLVQAHEPAPSMFASIKFFVSSPTLMLTALSCGMTAFVGYAMLNWIPAFLMRAKGMSLMELGAYYSVMSGVSMAIGTFASGWIVDKLARKNPAAYAIVPGVCILLSTPFLWGAVHAPGWQVAIFFLAFPSLLNNAYLAPALAVVQNGVPPNARGTSGALLLFVLNLIGLGGGPLFVGTVSDWLKPHYGVDSLKYALLALTPFFILAFLCQMAAAVMLRRQARMKAAALAAA